MEVIISGNFNNTKKNYTINYLDLHECFVCFKI